MVGLKVALLGAVATVALLPVAAMAQEAAAGDGINDIVVTAEKRETSVQKTPIAVSVFDSAALSRNGVGNLQDLTALAPSVAFAQNSAATIVTIRGVSSRDTTEIGDPAVSISSDGFYYQRPFGLNDAAFDLERVEVLRGPQGTLYGRNATGGAINFITAKPKDTFGASTTLGYGTYNLMTAEGFINVPVAEGLSTRASFSARRRDGYRTNNYVGKDGDDADSISGRFSVLAKPTERLSINLIAQYTKIGGIGPVFFGVPIVGAVNNNVQPNFDRKGTVLGSPRQSTDIDSKSLQAIVNYNLDFATFTYLGGYRNQKIAQVRDLDGLLKSDAYFIAGENAKDWQHEARLTSQGDGPFKWQFGGFYFHEKNNVRSDFVTYANPIGLGQPLARFIFAYPRTIAKSKAAFGQASYEVIEGLSIEGGIRYSKDNKSRAGFTNTTNTAYTGVGDRQVSARSGSDKWTYHIAANWQLTPSNLLYIKRDTGYKAGGFSEVAVVGTVPYGPESITSYEFGSKNRFLDGMAQLNVSAYLYNYTDQQISQFNNGFTAIFNAGKSRIWGVEVEGILKPSAQDQFDGYVGYLHARFRDFLVSGVQYAGNSPPQSPSWQVNAGYQHDFLLGEGRLTPRVQTHYESTSYLGFQNFPIQRVKAYSRSDAMLTYTAPDSKWSLQGYVRNIENRTVLTYQQTNTLWAAYNFQFADPRTYGARLTFNF